MKTPTAFRVLLPMLALLAVPAAAASSAPERFMETLSQYCGAAYGGRVLSEGSAQGFTGRTLIVHLAECHADEIRMPFQVSDYRSHALIVTRTENGLRLAHAHEAADGAPQTLSNYGGDSTNGTATRQEFRVDAHSIAKLEAEGIAHAAGNVWALEVVGGSVLRYELVRAEGPALVIEFDLANPVDLAEPVIAYQARMDGGERFVASILD
ncbi:MAG: hypothetical protein LC632_09165 [Xanthomonadaceae bacterium]|nr:hypothetical protein [Xanthomonadaceae bacterium]